MLAFGLGLSCNTQRDRETERQRDRETERQRDRETERQRDRETEKVERENCEIYGSYLKEPLLRSTGPLVCCNKPTVTQGKLNT